MKALAPALAKAFSLVSPPVHPEPVRFLLQSRETTGLMLQAAAELLQEHSSCTTLQQHRAEEAPIVLLLPPALTPCSRQSTQELIPLLAGAEVLLRSRLPIFHHCLLCAYKSPP